MDINPKSDLQTLYDGRATVYGQTNGTKDDNGITRQSEQSLYSDIPCRLSYRTKNRNVQEEVGHLDQTIILILDNSYDIPSGSKITVTQYGQTHTYQSSGLPAMYNSHQEIELITFREYA